MVRPAVRHVLAVGAIVLLIGSTFAIVPQIWPPDPDASLKVRNGQIVGETTGFVWATDPRTATIQVSASLVGLRTVPVTVNGDTRIIDGDKEGAFGDLGKYARVRIVYEARDHGRLASSIELLHAGRSGSASAADVADAPPATGYWVEVGVFTDAEAASTLTERLLEHNLTVSMETVTLRGQEQPIVRVQVGPYGDEAAATAAQQNLRAIGYQAGLVGSR